MQQNSLTTAGDTDWFLTPERIVRYFDLEKGDHVADFGAGHGYFTIPMARVVGAEGRVYAIDIQKSVLDIIRAKAKLEHLLNIEPVWTDVDTFGGSKLRDGFIDFVVIANTLFQSEDKETVLKEAYRVLREKGKLAIIEWDENDRSALGPGKNLRIKKEAAVNLTLETGFKPDREFEAGSHHYGLLFIKS